MAIDLFCYVSVDRNLTDAMRSELLIDRRDIFSENFIISTAKDASPMHVEIAAENGFEAKSFFLISLNKKDSVNLLGLVSQILKDKFGSNILILQENERKL